MTSTAPTPTSRDDLNAEPSVPADWKEQNLPPKSYATAAHENLNGDHQKQTSGSLEDESKSLKNKKQQPSGDPDMAKAKKQVKRQPKKGLPSMDTTQNPQVDGSKETPQESNQASPPATSPLVHEHFEDQSSNEGLTSIEVDDSYRAGLAANHAEARLRSPPTPRQKPSSSSTSPPETLVSGRRAGTGWERSGMRFAPLSIPLKRRLQTFILLLHTLSIPFFVSLFFFLCAIPPLWPLLFVYTLYILLSSAGTSGTLSHRSSFLRSLRLWSLFASYYPARLHRSTPLPPTRKYIFGYHPHGIISHGAFAAFATEALGFAQLFPGITNTLLTLESNFRIPLYRDYILALGLGSVSRDSCLNLLSKGGHNGEGMGRAITIVVGGARESLDAQPYTLRLVLKRRQGFVKLAIKSGADLVPVLAFGENDLYDVVGEEGHPGLRRVQLEMKKGLGWTIPLFHARGVFNYDVGLMPYRRALDVVVGKPIQVRQQDKPDQKYVDEVHERYMQELQRLWDTWKDTFAKERQAEMEITE